MIRNAADALHEAIACWLHDFARRVLRLDLLERRVAELERSVGR